MIKFPYPKWLTRIFNNEELVGWVIFAGILFTGLFLFIVGFFLKDWLALIGIISGVIVLLGMLGAGIICMIRKKTTIGGVLIGIPIFICMLLPTPKEPKKIPKPWHERDCSGTALFMIKEHVKNRLKASSTAKFPGLFDGGDHVYRKKQKYTVISYVDAQNGFGAMIRTKFIGQIEQVSDGNWKLISLTFEQEILQ